MADDAKDLMRRFYDAVSAGDLDVIDQIVAEDFVEHEPFPGIPPDKEGVRQFFRVFRAAFPDLHMEPHEMLVDGDLACARITVTGTHQADFLGIPPSDRQIEIGGFDMLRLRDGLVTEHWGLTDTLTMLEQLGAGPQKAAG